MLSERTRLVGVSTVYCSEPDGPIDQPMFFNAVAEIVTELAASELKFGVLRKIEDELGRIRTGDKYAPRTVDLDIIVYGDEIARSEELEIPDPQIESRAFLSVPLCELAPELVVPGHGPIKETAARHRDHSMTALPELTADIRKDLKDEPRKSAGAR